MTTYICQNCRHFGDERGEDHDGSGLCRFDPPQLIVVSGGDWPETMWPRVMADEWCGEWAPIDTNDVTNCRKTTTAIEAMTPEQKHKAWIRMKDAMYREGDK